MQDTIIFQRFIAKRHPVDIALAAFFDHQRSPLRVDLHTASNSSWMFAVCINKDDMNADTNWSWKNYTSFIKPLPKESFLKR